MHIRRAEEEKAKKKERNVRYNTLVIVVVLQFLIRFIWSVLFLPVWLSLVLLNGPFML